MAQSYEYKGVVEEISKTQHFDSGFSKRDLILGNPNSSTSKYQNYVKFTFKKDNCDMLDGIKKGQEVTVKFVIDGRKWDGPKGVQYFVDLTGIRVDINKATDCPPPAELSEKEKEEIKSSPYPNDDDIPF